MTEDDQAVRGVERWLAENLKAGREAAGLSQDTVAERMRERGHDVWRQQTVARVETGQRSVRFGEAYDLARIVGSSFDDLARPPERTREGMALKSAVSSLQDAWRTLLPSAEYYADARRRLEQLVAQVEAEGKAEDLAAEVRLAGQVLRTTQEPLIEAFLAERLQRVEVARADQAALKATQAGLPAQEIEPED